jgi:hypothetical protein
VLPFTVILGAFGPTAVKSLVSGQDLGPDAYGEVTSQVLSAVLAQQSDVAASLQRIETKLDALLVQDYEHTLGAAHRELDFASQPWREPVEREEALSKARDLFSRAAAATGGDAYRLGVAEWYLAVISILRARPMDARQSLRASAQAALNAIYDADAVFKDPPQQLVNEAVPAGKGWRARVFGQLSDALDDAYLSVRERVVTRALAASDLLEAAVQAHETLGEDGADHPLYWYSPPPRNYRAYGATEAFMLNVRFYRIDPWSPRAVKDQLNWPPSVVREPLGGVLPLEDGDVEILDCIKQLSVPTGSRLPPPVFLRVRARPHHSGMNFHAALLRATDPKDPPPKGVLDVNWSGVDYDLAARHTSSPVNMRSVDPSFDPQPMHSRERIGGDGWLSVSWKEALPLIPLHHVLACWSSGTEPRYRVDLPVNFV